MFRNMLEKNQNAIWTAISNEHGVVKKPITKKLINKKINGDLRLAIDCCYGAVDKWLSQNFTSTSNGWFRSNFSKTNLHKLIKDLKTQNVHYPDRGRP